MDPELRDLLRTNSSDQNGESHTHVTLYGPQARWSVKPQFHSSFWTGYCDLVHAKNNGQNPDPFAELCLAEKAQDMMPQIAKLTLKFHSDVEDDTWEPYDDYFLQCICHTYQEVLAEYFQLITDNQLELLVLVLDSVTHWYEKDESNGQRYMLMEIRLQFPYARIDAGIQTRFVRPRVIQLLRNANILAKLERHPIGDWEQIISVNAANEPLVMFGSTEASGRPKLKLSHIWSRITKDMLEDNNYIPEIELEDSFEPTNHQHVQQQTMDAGVFQQEPDLNYWLPLFLSVWYWPPVLLPKKGDIDRFKVQEPQQQHVFGTKYKDSLDQGEMELCERMIQMLKPDRFLREAFWLDIGKALYSSDDGGENGILSWIRHTLRAVGDINTPRFMMVADTLEESCRNLYYTFENSNITVKTLAWYAREDNPEQYSNWHRDWCMPSMEQALSGYHTDVANALFRVYWLDFAFCPIGRGRWFQFKKHRWSEVNQGIDLRKAISSDFMRRFESIRMVLSRQIHDSSDESFKSNGEITLKKITSLITKLKTTAFKSSIMIEVSESFKHDTFTNLLDVNTNLLGVTNGILEAHGNQVIFRCAKPEDYISMCANIPFHDMYSWNHPLTKECLEWLKKVFPDKKLLHHFLKFAASCLRGRNSDKIFPIWTGNGDNSKSMIVKLFEAVFGAYCIKFPISMISEKAMNSSGPTPQLARAKSTRVAFLDEGDDDVSLSKATIKRFTGGDSFFARLLQENGGDVQATFKLVLTCNKVPVITNPDKPIKGRTKLFPFMSKFVSNPPTDPEEQYEQKLFKKDPFFEKRIPILAPAFLWIMTQYFPHYVEEGLVDPEIVTETTESYWRDNDVYAQFVADAVQEINDENGQRDTSVKVCLNEIYGEFKTWFKDAFPGTRVPERSIVRSELSSRWGRMYGNSWYGIRLMTNDGPVDMSASLGAKKKPSKPLNSPTLVVVDVPTTKPIAKESPIFVLGHREPLPSLVPI